MLFSIFNISFEVVSHNNWHYCTLHSVIDRALSNFKTISNRCHKVKLHFTHKRLQTEISWMRWQGPRSYSWYWQNAWIIMTHGWSIIHENAKCVNDCKVMLTFGNYYIICNDWNINACKLCFCLGKRGEINTQI